MWVTYPCAQSCCGTLVQGALSLSVELPTCLALAMKKSINDRNERGVTIASLLLTIHTGLAYTGAMLLLVYNHGPDVRAITQLLIEPL